MVVVVIPLPSLPGAPVAPVSPFAPSETLAIVMVSEVPPPAAFTAIVRAVMVAPVMVTVLPERLTPSGTVPLKVPPLTLYCQPVVLLGIVVLSAVPVIVEVAGVVAPPPGGDTSA